MSPFFVPPKTNPFSGTVSNVCKLSYTFMNPSLFSLCMLLAALCSLLLCERSTESATCHQVLQLSSRARPTTLATATSTAFTVTLAESTLNIAKRAIPVTRHAKVSANRTKDGTQHVFFHFFPEDGEQKAKTNAVIVRHALTWPELILKKERKPSRYANTHSLSPWDCRTNKVMT